jgi:hypothetical protein
MEAILERCAGLDVHQETVVACVLYGELDRKPKQEIRTFSTTTKGLLALHDWISDWECTYVAMESTGVYWKPGWNILEEQFTLILANARRIKNVPDRKTDGWYLHFTKKSDFFVLLLLKKGLSPSRYTFGIAPFLSDWLSLYEICCFNLTINGYILAFCP